MTTPPKRDVRAALTIGGLLLIPLAALWLLLNPAHGPRSGGSSAPTPEEIRQGIRDGTMGVPGSENTPTNPGTPTKISTPTDPGQPRVPPPRVAAGAPQQADFTLLGVSYISRGDPSPPPPLAPPGTAGSLSIQTVIGAVGVWIGVQGGMGIKTITVPRDGRRHVYPFGRFSLVADPRLSGTTVYGSTVYDSMQWEESGGLSPLRLSPLGLPFIGTGTQPPYRLSFSSTGSPVVMSDRTPETVTLTPMPFAAQFRITVLPLSAAGRPTGKAVSLLCQPVTAAALFTQIPPGYSAATRQFRVTVARTSGKGKSASWLITDLPPAVEDAQKKTNGQAPTPVNSARIGPFVLRAVAAEAEDASIYTDLSNPHPLRQGGPSPQNMDQHQWTGLPALRCLLYARAAQAVPLGQNWLFQLNRVTPQWGMSPAPPLPVSFQSVGGGFPGASPGAAAPPLSGSGASAGGYPGESMAGGPGPIPPHLSPKHGTPGGTGTPGGGGYPGGGGGSAGGAGDRPLGVYPLSRFLLKPDPAEWLLLDGEVGAAWPGQQRRLTLQGTAIRQTTRTETVTFHDAEVVWDAGFGGDRIVWHHPETETTASGIAVTVVNGRPGKRDTGGQSFGQDWWYDRGNAELLLAWHLPPGFVSGAGAALNTPRVAKPPQGAAPKGAVRPGALEASWDNTHDAPYIGAVSLPGTTADTRPLKRDGYSPLRLSVWAAQSPTRTFTPPTSPPQPSPLPALPRYSWRDGPFVMKAAPLPRHLATITLQITIREEQERRPVVLRVPVAATFPPGADPRPVLRRATPVLIHRSPPPPVPPAPRGRDTGTGIGKPAIAQM